MRVPLVLRTVFLLCSPLIVAAAEDPADDPRCSPYRWTNPGDPTQATTTASPTPSHTFAVEPKGADIKPGDVNCRGWSFTYESVDHCTCKELAYKWGIDVSKFFQLNPMLLPDCSNARTYTMYCVAGFIEPVRAWDRKCGPSHNATCIGTKFPCCNADTWTCGNTTADCADGTCWSGACLGHKVYSTDGTCGQQNGMRKCSKRWGECCNRDGVCGSGEAFCGLENCQMGKCTAFEKVWTSQDVPWQVGNTTDGSCGGPDKLVCDVTYGNCCNKDGKCGSRASDCGTGCQPEFGSCSGVPAPWAQRLPLHLQRLFASEFTSSAMPSTATTTASSSSTTLPSSISSMSTSTTTSAARWQDL